MREIRFRVWDGERMRPVLRIDFDDVVPIATAPGEKPTVELGNFPAESRLMQYTGLKDKNGVEIYEGDVLNVGSEPYMRVVVRFGIYRPEDVDSENGGNGFYEEVVTDPGGPCSVAWGYSDGEVIGNIYENPELLDVAVTET